MAEVVELRIQSLLLLNRVSYCKKDAANDQPTALRIVNRSNDATIQVIDEVKLDIISEHDLPVVEKHGSASKELSGIITSGDMGPVEAILLSTSFVKVVLSSGGPLSIEGKERVHECSFLEGHPREHP